MNFIAFLVYTKVGGEFIVFKAYLKKFLSQINLLVTIWGLRVKKLHFLLEDLSICLCT
jgi:hypothetical protein